MMESIWEGKELQPALTKLQCFFAHFFCIAETPYHLNYHVNTTVNEYDSYKNESFRTSVVTVN